MMIHENQNHRDDAAKNVEYQNAAEYFASLVFGVKISAKIGNENQNNSGEAEHILLQHEKYRQKCSH